MVEEKKIHSEELKELHKLNHELRNKVFYMKEMLDSKNYDKLEGKTKETVGYDVTFTITNSGDVKGSDVAQIYLGAPVSRDGIDEGVQFHTGIQTANLKRMLKA